MALSRTQQEYWMTITDRANPSGLEQSESEISMILMIFYQNLSRFHILIEPPLLIFLDPSLHHVLLLLCSVHIQLMQSMYADMKLFLLAQLDLVILPLFRLDVLVLLRVIKLSHQTSI